MRFGYYKKCMNKGSNNFIAGDGIWSRTENHSFADRCLSSWLSRNLKNDTLEYPGLSDQLLLPNLSHLHILSVKSYVIFLDTQTLYT